jgi:antitoxin HigA-1
VKKEKDFCLGFIPPGTILQEKFMQPLGITAYRLSKEIKVQQTAVSQIINGSRRITVDMALRLSRYFGNSAQFWLNLQNHYDIEIPCQLIFSMSLFPGHLYIFSCLFYVKL